MPEPSEPRRPHGFAVIPLRNFCLVTRIGQRYRIRARNFTIDSDLIRFFEDPGGHPTAVFALRSIRFMHDEDATPVEELGGRGESRKGESARRARRSRGGVPRPPDRPASPRGAGAPPASEPRGRANIEPGEWGGGHSPGSTDAPPRDLAGALTEEAYSLDYYILVGRAPIRERSFERWRDWMFKASLTVNTSRVGPYQVVTQFLGVAILGSKPPKLWLSTVTERGREVFAGRCAGSWEQAEALHCEMFGRANQLTRGQPAPQTTWGCNGVH